MNDKLLLRSLDMNSRYHSAVGAKLGLVESVFAVLPHQVVWMWPVGLVLCHQVNTDLPFTAVVLDLWTNMQKVQTRL